MVKPTVFKKDGGLRDPSRGEKIDLELRCPSTLCRSVNLTLTHDCNSRRDDV